MGYRIYVPHKAIYCNFLRFFYLKYAVFFFFALLGPQNSVPFKERLDYSLRGWIDVMALVALTCLIVSHNIACSIVLRSAFSESFTYLQRRGKTWPTIKDNELFSNYNLKNETYIVDMNQFYRDNDNTPLLGHSPPETFANLLLDWIFSCRLAGPEWVQETAAQFLGYGSCLWIKRCSRPE
jgi:hypothetical protein